MSVGMVVLFAAACGGASTARVPPGAIAPPFLLAAPQATATPVPGAAFFIPVPAEETQRTRLLPPASAQPPRQSVDTAPPTLSARAAVVIDEASGAVLFAKDAHLRLAPASLTKIATAAVALEQGDLDQPVDVTIDSTAMRGSSVMGLLPGDRFTLRDLLYGLMLPSGNDAALAIGRAISGSDGAFVQQMNLLAARLGLQDTHFVNAHGLSARGHLTSAYDLAILARYAMSVPGFAAIVATPAWEANGSRTIELTNVNTMLGSYPGADGVKTGFTNQAGKTLVASATRDGHRLYAVVLNAPDRDKDGAALLDWAFASFTWGGSDT
jgi:D-alanyl-D-alanine carboxypeptidase